MSFIDCSPFGKQLEDFSSYPWLNKIDAALTLPGESYDAISSAISMCANEAKMDIHDILEVVSFYVVALEKHTFDELETFSKFLKTCTASLAGNLHMLFTAVIKRASDARIVELFSDQLFSESGAVEISQFIMSAMAAGKSALGGMKLIAKIFGDGINGDVMKIVISNFVDYGLWRFKPDLVTDAITGLGDLSKIIVDDIQTKVGKFCCPSKYAGFIDAILNVVQLTPNAAKKLLDSVQSAKSYYISKINSCWTFCRKKFTPTHAEFRFLDSLESKIEDIASAAVERVKAVKAGGKAAAKEVKESKIAEKVAAEAAAKEAKATAKAAASESKAAAKAAKAAAKAEAKKPKVAEKAEAVAVEVATDEAKPPSIKSLKKRAREAVKAAKSDAAATRKAEIKAAKSQIKDAKLKERAVLKELKNNEKISESALDTNVLNSL